MGNAAGAAYSGSPKSALTQFSNIGQESRFASDAAFFNRASNSSQRQLSKSSTLSSAVIVPDPLEPCVQQTVRFRIVLANVSAAFWEVSKQRELLCRLVRNCCEGYIGAVPKALQLNAAAFRLNIGDPPLASNSAAATAAAAAAAAASTAEFPPRFFDASISLRGRVRASEELALKILARLRDTFSQVSKRSQALSYGLRQALKDTSSFEQGTFRASLWLEDVWIEPACVVSRPLPNQDPPSGTDIGREKRIEEFQNAARDLFSRAQARLRMLRGRIAVELSSDSANGATGGEGRACSEEEQFTFNPDSGEATLTRRNGQEGTYRLVRADEDDDNDGGTDTHGRSKSSESSHLVLLVEEPLRLKPPAGSDQALLDMLQSPVEGKQSESDKDLDERAGMHRRRPLLSSILQFDELNGKLVECCMESAESSSTVTAMDLREGEVVRVSASRNGDCRIQQQQSGEIEAEASDTSWTDVLFCDACHLEVCSGDGQRRRQTLPDGTVIESRYQHNNGSPGPSLNDVDEGGNGPGCSSVTGSKSLSSPSNNEAQSPRLCLTYRFWNGYEVDIDADGNRVDRLPGQRQTCHEQVSLPTPCWWEWEQGSAQNAHHRSSGDAQKMLPSQYAWPRRVQPIVRSASSSSVPLNEQINSLVEFADTTQQQKRTRPGSPLSRLLQSTTRAPGTKAAIVDESIESKTAPTLASPHRKKHSKSSKKKKKKQTTSSSASTSSVRTEKATVERAKGAKPSKPTRTQKKPISDVKATTQRQTSMTDYFAAGQAAARALKERQAAEAQKLAEKSDSSQAEQSRKRLLLRKVRVKAEFGGWIQLKDLNARAFCGERGCGSTRSDRGGPASSSEACLRRAFQQTLQSGVEGCGKEVYEWVVSAELDSVEQPKWRASGRGGGGGGFSAIVSFTCSVRAEVEIQASEPLSSAGTISENTFQQDQVTQALKLLAVEKHLQNILEDRPDDFVRKLRLSANDVVREATEVQEEHTNQGISNLLNNFPSARIASFSLAPAHLVCAPLVVGGTTNHGDVRVSTDRVLDKANPDWKTCRGVVRINKLDPVVFTASLEAQEALSESLRVVVQAAGPYGVQARDLRVELGNASAGAHVDGGRGSYVANIPYRIELHGAAAQNGTPKKVVEALHVALNTEDGRITFLQQFWEASGLS